jgi:predicted component of type VI protein secretion system
VWGQKAMNAAETAFNRMMQNFDPANLASLGP